VLDTVFDGITKRDYQVLYCEIGDLAFTNPYPTEETIGILYEDKSSTLNFDFINDSIVDKLKDYFGKKTIKSFSRGLDVNRVDRVLDFGTGNGRYAVLSAKVFKNAFVHAVDYQKDPPPILKKQSLQNIQYINITDFNERTEKYDFIILRHVLEHNHHPIELLRTLASKLSRKGIIYIEVPSLSSGILKVFGKKINGYSIPYHLYHYSARSLGYIVKSGGLDCIIGYNEMPLMGGVIAALLKRERNIFFQLLGIVLNPIQLFLSRIYGPPCINVKCSLPTLIKPVE
jgi:SAM-dependent methyltransferase